MFLNFGHFSALRSYKKERTEEYFLSSGILFVIEVFVAFDEF